MIAPSHTHIHLKMSHTVLSVKGIIYRYFYINIARLYGGKVKMVRFDYRVMVIKLKIDIQENVVITLCLTEHK